MFRKIKQSWNAFILRLAKENEKQFGNKRADCCDLNKPHNGGEK